MNETKPSLYIELGGEAGLRRLVTAFYLYMDLNPEMRQLREQHPDNLESSADKLFMFLSGWSGGPSLFTEKYGHPMMRARHRPFRIGKVERDQWMICMAHATETCEIKEPVRSEFLHALLRLADHMRNQPEADEA